MSTDQSYSVVLKDLEDREQRCAIEIERITDEQKAIKQAIATLRLFKVAQSTLPFTRPRAVPITVDSDQLPPPTATPTPGRYSGLSTRWAILCLLAEHAPEPMGRADIAKALTDGGMTSTAQSFASNVSAVLSGMANERHEVQQVDNGGYRITDHGRDVWEGVKRTPQWNNRNATSVAS